MNYLKNYVLAAAFFIFGFLTQTSSAQADILIEPYAGYMATKSNGTMNIPSRTPPEYTVDDSFTKGGIAGARIGYNILFFSLGLDGMGGNLSSGDDTYKMTNLGAFVAIDMPIFVRFYGSYFFSSTATTDALSTTHGDVKFEGSGYRAGIGFTFLPFVSINVEYIETNYDDDDHTDLTNVDIDNKGIIVGLSLPLTF